MLNSVIVTGYAQPIAFDPDYKNQKGYFICQICKKKFFLNTELMSPCQENQQHQFIYVFGKNEQYTTLTKAKIDEIKKTIF